MLTKATFRASSQLIVPDLTGSALRHINSMNGDRGKANPLRVVSVLVAADVHFLDLDIVPADLASFLPLGICTGFLSLDEGVLELDRCVPRLLLLESEVQVWKIRVRVRVCV